jgi:hypothetical protein
MLFISLVTTGQDYLSALARRGSYYFSESLLFSSFWWIFPPLLWIQLRQLGQSKTETFHTRIWWMTWPMVTHLLLYPTVVASLGQLTMGHGFRWVNTLTYGISQYGVVLLLTYTVPILAVGFVRKRHAEHPPEASEDNLSSPPAIAEPKNPKAFLDIIMAKEGTKTIIVPIGDILLFTSASPYVKLHGAKRQLLVTETLRNLSSRLDPSRFCRIHKSAIVQLDAVVEMRSRLNGDYDLILADGSMTRLSRSYVHRFRKVIDLHGHLREVRADTTRG